MASCGYRALADFPEVVHTINLLPEAVRVLLHSPYGLKPETSQFNAQPLQTSTIDL